MPFARMLGPVLTVAVGSGQAADQGCPAPRAVAEALEARLPGILAPDRVALGAQTLRLTVVAEPQAPTVGIELADGAGATRLRRDLPAVPDCSALADTVALIVERHLRAVGYQGPAEAEIAARPPAVEAREPPAQDPGRAPIVDLRAGIGVRGPPRDLGDADLLAGVGARSGRLGISVLFGAAAPAHVRLPDGGSADLIRFPLRLRGHLAVAGERFEAATAVGADVMRGGTSGVARPSSASRTSPVIEAGLGYRWPLGRRTFLRPEVIAGVALSRFDFTVDRDAGGRETVFRTPGAYIRLGLEAAMSFGLTKNAGGAP